MKEDFERIHLEGNVCCIWRGPGWYGCRADGVNYYRMAQVNLDGWEEWEVSEAAHRQGLGTPRYYFERPKQWPRL